MFYVVKVEDHVRVEPKHFGLPTHEAVRKQLNETFVNTFHKEIGYVLSVIEVHAIDDGVIIPGDGSAFYNSTFSLLVWKPELHELVYGSIVDIAQFGAFMQIGPTQAMVHISQTMEDYVSLSKTGTLSGKVTKRVLGKGDDCIARIVAISYKAGNPKIGLTMRQPGLGSLDWIKEEKRKKSVVVKVPKKSKKGAKS